MNNIPLISIIIPVYNRVDIISETLDSVLSQSYQNWECIIVDDGSTDNSWDFLSEYIKKDSRFHLYKRPNNRKSGGCGARNFGYLKSKGKYVKWLDSDDIIEKELVEKEVQKLEENRELKFVYCGMTFLEDKNQQRNSGLISLESGTGIQLLNRIGIIREYILPGGCTIRKTVIPFSGLWNEELKINQDGEFLFRVLINCDWISSIDYIGFRYRLENANKITSGYNDSEKVILKLKSWQLIDSQINIRKENDLEDYINGTKNFLYKYHLHLRQYKIITEFHELFWKQIKEEKRKRILVKLLPMMVWRCISAHLKF